MYAHLWHVDGERGEVDRELILGPFEGVQLTYSLLRETKNGADIAKHSYQDDCWYPLNGERLLSYSDITFSEDSPASIVG